MHRIGIVRDPRFLDHKTGVHHIEVPRRLEAIYAMLDADALTSQLQLVPPRVASLEDIEMIHTPEYIDKILDTAGEPLRYLDPDTVTSEKSCEVAFLAAGSVLAAVDQVFSGVLDTVFALIRPPGHHAERNRQMGFCLFNNIAIAAAYAQRTYRCERILIVDWDVHHPNGTQHIFETSPQVLLFSTHRFPFFPGTGALSEIGRGQGCGFTVNVPLPARTDDRDFAFVYYQLLEPLAFEYQPDLILVSAGFDTHRDDPIGGMQMTENGYRFLTDTVLRIADATCGGKTIFLLEGGYDLGALRKSVKAVLETMHDGLEKSSCSFANALPRSDSPVFDIVASVKAQIAPYWKSFAGAV